MASVTYYYVNRYKGSVFRLGNENVLDILGAPGYPRGQEKQLSTLRQWQMCLAPLSFRCRLENVATTHEIVQHKLIRATAL